MVICPQCGKGTPAGKFCEHCGSHLPDMPAPGSPLYPPAPATVQSPVTVYPQPASSAQAPVVKGTGPGPGAIIIMVIIILAVLALIGYLSDNPDGGTGIPPITVETTVPTWTGTGHVPSEVISGSVMSGGSYQITTHLRDPETTSYAVRLSGPKAADLDLYIRKGAPPTTNTFDYHSSGADSNEQIRVSNPEIGDYYILVQSIRGGGDFTLTFTYQYA